MNRTWPKADEFFTTTPKSRVIRWLNVIWPVSSNKGEQATAFLQYSIRTQSQYMDPQSFSKSFGNWKLTIIRWLAPDFHRNLRLRRRSVLEYIIIDFFSSGIRGEWPKIILPHKHDLSRALHNHHPRCSFNRVRISCIGPVINSPLVIYLRTCSKPT